MIFNYIFVINYKLGVEGLAIATSLSSFLAFTAMILFTYKNIELRQTLFMPNSSTFKNLWSYLKLAIPGMFMTCLAWWGWEL